MEENTHQENLASVQETEEVARAKEEVVHLTARLEEVTRERSGEKEQLENEVSYLSRPQVSIFSVLALILLFQLFSLSQPKS